MSLHNHRYTFYGSSSMRFGQFCTQPCSYYRDQDTEHFRFPQSSSCLITVNTLPEPPAPAPANLVIIVCLSRIFYKRNDTICCFFGIWLFSLTIMFLRCIPVVACITVCFSFWLDNISQNNYNLFAHLPIDGRLGYFQILAVLSMWLGIMLLWIFT